MTATGRATSRVRGFTLLELMISIALLVFLAGMMLQVITGTTRNTQRVNDALRGPKIANAIFSQIFRDFRYIYWGGFRGDAGFRGKANQIAGRDADRVDFVTSRPTRTVGFEDDGRRREGEATSPLTEVGWACRVNETNPEFLELWRREDAFVDDQPTQGGHYTLVYDRIKAFRLRYFPIPEEAEVKEGLEAWDSSQRKGIPYAILLRIDFDVDAGENEEGEEESEVEPIFRIILLRGAYSVRWTDPEPPAETTGTPGR